MAKLDGKPLWIVMGIEGVEDPEEIIAKVEYGDHLINLIRGTNRPWDENWSYYDNEREARADAEKRVVKLSKKARTVVSRYLSDQMRQEIESWWDLHDERNQDKLIRELHLPGDDYTQWTPDQWEKLVKHYNESAEMVR
jgi:hypothetical protein